MSCRERITVEPGKRGGQPCIRGLRISVYNVLEQSAAGLSPEQIIEDFRNWKSMISAPPWRSPRTPNFGCE